MDPKSNISFDGSSQKPLLGWTSCPFEHRDPARLFILQPEFEQVFAPLFSGLKEHSKRAKSRCIQRRTIASTWQLEPPPLSMVAQTQEALIPVSVMDGNHPTSSSLVDLPAEIRLIILGLLLVPGCWIFIYCRRRHKTDVKEGGIEPQILRTCKRVHQEGCQLLYSKNVFQTWNTLLQDFSEGFLCDIGATNRSLIKRLLIDDRYYSSLDCAQLLREQPIPEFTKLFEGHLQLRNLEAFGVGFRWKDHTIRGPRLIASLIESHFGLTGREYTARCRSLKDKADGYDALVRGRILGAAASLQGIPEIHHACEQKRPSRWDRWTIFSRTPYGLSTREAVERDGWLVSGAASALDYLPESNRL